MAPAFDLMDFLHGAVENTPLRTDDFPETKLRASHHVNSFFNPLRIFENIDSEEDRGRIAGHRAGEAHFLVKGASGGKEINPGCEHKKSDRHAENPDQIDRD